MAAKTQTRKVSSRSRQICASLRRRSGVSWTVLLFAVALSTGLSLLSGCGSSSESSSSGDGVGSSSNGAPGGAPENTTTPTPPTNPPTVVWETPSGSDFISRTTSRSLSYDWSLDSNFSKSSPSLNVSSVYRVDAPAGYKAFQTLVPQGLNQVVYVYQAGGSGPEAFGTRVDIAASVVAPAIRAQRSHPDFRTEATFSSRRGFILGGILRNQVGAVLYVFDSQSPETSVPIQTISLPLAQSIVQITADTGEQNLFVTYKTNTTTVLQRWPFSILTTPLAVEPTASSWASTTPFAGIREIGASWIAVAQNSGNPYLAQIDTSNPTLTLNPLVTLASTLAPTAFRWIAFRSFSALYHDAPQRFFAWTQTQLTQRPVVAATTTDVSFALNGGLTSIGRYLFAGTASRGVYAFDAFAPNQISKVGSLTAAADQALFLRQTTGMTTINLGVSAYLSAAVGSPTSSYFEVMSIQNRNTLTASRYYSPSRWVGDRIQLFQPRSITIPAYLPVTSGNAGNQFANLMFDDVVCRYRGGSSTPNPSPSNTQWSAGLRYVFVDCSNGMSAGQAIPTYETVSLDIQSGHSGFSPTRVSLSL